MDKSITAANNQIVVTIVNDELTIKRLIFCFPKTYLHLENLKYKTIKATHYTIKMLEFLLILDKSKEQRQADALLVLEILIIID